MYEKTRLYECKSVPNSAENDVQHWNKSTIDPEIPCVLVHIDEILLGTFTMVLAR